MELVFLTVWNEYSKLKKYRKNQQAEILLIMLGDKANNLLIYTTREQTEL